MDSITRKLRHHFTYGIILAGYDIEARAEYGDGKSTRLFFDNAVPIHNNLRIPCTAFALGQTLLENVELFQKISAEPMWNIEQHTFSHVPFRSIEPCDENWKSVKGATIADISYEVSKANELIQRILGITCNGLCAPKGYFNGLRGRKDILRVLEADSIKFVRSYGRNENDWQPVPFEVQPFWYEEDGFPDILEVPMQGWQDTIWRRTFGWNNRSGFLKYLRESVDYVLQKHLVWSCAFHDWSCIREDPDLNIMKEFFKYALKKGATFLSHLAFYEMMKKEKEAK